MCPPCFSNRTLPTGCHFPRAVLIAGSQDKNYALTTKNKATIVKKNFSIYFIEGYNHTMFVFLQLNHYIFDQQWSVV